MKFLTSIAALLGLGVTGCRHLGPREPASSSGAEMTALIKGSNCAPAAPRRDPPPDRTAAELAFYDLRDRQFTLPDRGASFDHLTPAARLALLREKDTAFEREIEQSHPDWLALYRRAETCGLTTAERAAVKSWGIGVPYWDVNADLRANADAGARKWATFTAVFDAALEKLRAYHGRVRRGITLSEADLSAYAPKSVITWPAYSSTAVIRAFPGNAQFTIESVRGRFISPLSATPLEDEVLLPRNTRFEVLAHVVDAQGNHRIKLRELP